MSRADKRLEAMRRNPGDGWTIDDVKAVCAAVGMTCRAPARGSHYTVSHPSRNDILTIPARRPVKRVYIEALVRFVDDVLSK